MDLVLVKSFFTELLLIMKEPGGIFTFTLT